MARIQLISSGLRRSVVWGAGLIALIIIVLSGCSSSGSNTADPVATQPPQKIFPQPAQTEINLGVANPLKNTVAEYTPLDRAIIFNFAEKGDEDPGVLRQALAMIKKTEARPEDQRVAEDFLLLTIHYWRKGDKERVIQNATQGLKRAPKNKRMVSYLYLYTGLAYEEKDIKISQSSYRQAIQADPNFYRGHLQLARLLERTHNREASLKEYAQVALWDPGNKEARSKLKSAERASNKSERGPVKSTAGGTVKNQQPIELKIKQAANFQAQGKLAEAESILNELQKTHPADIRVHLAFAEYYHQQKKISREAKSLKRALALSPKPKDPVPGEAIEPSSPLGIVEALAKIYIRQQEYDQAEQVYLTAFQPSTKSVYAHTALAKVYKAQGKLNQELQEYESLLRLEPDAPDHWLSLARHFESRKDYMAAIRYYDKAHQLEPKLKTLPKKIDRLKVLKSRQYVDDEGFEVASNSTIPKKMRRSLAVPFGDGWSTLHRAAATGDLEKVKKLLDRGDKIDSINELDRTPLFVAAKRGQLDVVNLLLERGANPNAPDSLGGYTPLHAAARFKHAAVVTALLEKGAKVDARSDWGGTPLMIIMKHVWHRDASIPEILVKYGADIRAKNNSGCRAICFASIAGNHYAVKFLLEQGMDPNWKNGHGTTPLYFAVSNNRRLTVKVLLEGGADPKLKVDGVSPLDLARSRRNTKMTRILDNWIRNHKNHSKSASKK